ncbi:ScyD/ScyE family protein [Microbacterium sp. 179-B 1A2 NHS]|uniref:ScyD/ScyE family protein n=1 Tax=Microbacterium sp. 179-B 1A2 NHS TaxID=3142383 RepID=UPI0039A03FD5
MHNSRALLAGIAALGLVLATPAMASAGGRHTPAPDPVVRSTQVVAPFNLDVVGKRVYVADGFANTVGRLARDGSIRPVVADAPGASGVERSRDGRTIAFTTTEGGEAAITESGLNLWGSRGSKVYADTLAYETRRNPDRNVAYGVANPSACVQEALADAGLDATYTGIVDSHAYSVAQLGRSWVVADAGANALFTVDRRGRISTLAVLPAQPTRITAEMAAAVGLPDCVVGVTYRFEAVPTDVEVGRDGMLYVTTLPGGPESPVFGARGALWKVNPYSGKAKQIASGFLGATNLALGKKGEIYVAEYFAGAISVVKMGKKSHYLDLANVVAVETGQDGSLWAGTTIALDPSAPQVPGTIVQVTRR